MKNNYPLTILLAFILGSIGIALSIFAFIIVLAFGFEVSIGFYYFLGATLGASFFMLLFARIAQDVNDIMDNTKQTKKTSSEINKPVKEVTSAPVIQKSSKATTPAPVKPTAKNSYPITILLSFILGGIGIAITILIFIMVALFGIQTPSGFYYFLASMLAGSFFLLLFARIAQDVNDIKDNTKPVPVSSKQTNLIKPTPDDERKIPDKPITKIPVVDDIDFDEEPVSQKESVVDGAPVTEENSILDDTSTTEEENIE